MAQHCAHSELPFTALLPPVSPIHRIYTYFQLTYYIHTKHSMKYRIPHAPQAAEKEYLDLILVPVLQVCLRFHLHTKT